MVSAEVISSVVFNSVDAVNAVVVSGEHKTLFAGTAITQRPGCVRSFTLPLGVATPAQVNIRSIFAHGSYVFIFGLFY
jgi:hypothetical protein